MIGIEAQKALCLPRNTLLGLRWAMSQRRTPFRALWDDEPAAGFSFTRANLARAVPDISANTRSTATALVNQAFVSQIDRSGDVDCVRIQLQANTTYQIFLDGQDSNAGSL